MNIDKEMLRDYFVRDFRDFCKTCDRTCDISDGWEGRLEREIKSYFGGKGYEFISRPPFSPARMDSNEYIKLMNLWLKIPRDIAEKIMVFGEVPDLGVAQNAGAV